MCRKLLLMLPVGIEAGSLKSAIEPGGIKAQLARSFLAVVPTEKEHSLRFPQDQILFWKQSLTEESK